ncbi:MAG: DUF4351 domain-containing protein, partial [Magnetococcales bacterium]|nr:DUF4351 domain-containing protein [Magnetococcales bacterium]
PFAVVTLAHLTGKQTKNQPAERFRQKMRITRMLYERGFSRQQIIDLFRFIDWVLSLPEELDNQFWTDLSNFEENKKMPYITSVERIGEERGRLLGIQIGEQRGIQIGLQKGEQKGQANILTRLLQRRFGPLPDWAQEQISKADSKSLEEWSIQILDAHSLDEVFASRP